MLNLSTNGSRIALEDVTLEGKSKVDDNGGVIVFNGNVAQGSTPVISDNGGSLNVTLPARASVHPPLTRLLGAIASNLSRVQNTGIDETEIQVNIGSNPTAVQLTLDLNSTSVVLSKATQ